MTCRTSVIACPDALSVAQTARDIILKAAQRAIKKSGRFVLGLAGGNTPQQLYSLLKDANADWQYWHLVYGDERFLPIGHPERNSTVVQQAWLDHCHVPVANHHIIPDNLPLAETAALYSKTIASLLPMDVALLGIGEDGHTASLFPQNLAKDLASQAICIPVNNAPKPPAERVSLGYQALNGSRQVLFLAIGENKRKVVNEWQDNRSLPCNRVHGIEFTRLLTDLA